MVKVYLHQVGDVQRFIVRFFGGTRLLRCPFELTAPFNCQILTATVYRVHPAFSSFSCDRGFRVWPLSVCLWNFWIVHTLHMVSQLHVAKIHWNKCCWNAKYFAQTLVLPNFRVWSPHCIWRSISRRTRHSKMLRTFSEAFVMALISQPDNNAGLMIVQWMCNFLFLWF